METPQTYVGARRARKPADTDSPPGVRAPAPAADVRREAFAYLNRRELDFPDERFPTTASVGLPAARSRPPLRRHRGSLRLVATHIAAANQPEHRHLDAVGYVRSGPRIQGDVSPAGLVLDPCPVY
jgi:hypothetical protein